LKLLVDHNLSPSLAYSLQPLFPEHLIVALRDKFPPGTSDVDWIRTLDDEGGWSAITGERRLKTRPHERAALDRSKVVFFFLTGQWLKFSVAEQAWRLIRLVPAMATQSGLSEGLFDLPINSTSKLRQHGR
jgi:hypothetical protein